VPMVLGVGVYVSTLTVLAIAVDRYFVALITARVHGGRRPAVDTTLPVFTARRRNAIVP